MPSDCHRLQNEVANVRDVKPSAYKAWARLNDGGDLCLQAVLASGHGDETFSERETLVQAARSVCPRSYQTVPREPGHAARRGSGLLHPALAGSITHPRPAGTVTYCR